MFRRLVPFFLIAALACKQREVAVQVSLAGADSVSAPLPGVQVIAFPYDRDSIIAALESTAPTPKPNTEVVDSLFRSFRGPFQEYAHAGRGTAIISDSLNEVTRGLSLAPRNSATIKSLRADSIRLHHMRDSARKDIAARRLRLDSIRTDVERRGDSIRGVLRAWENSTYKGYDSITRSLMLRLGRDPVVDTTSKSGWTTMKLPSGTWWIHAKSWDAADPNYQWYWNVKVDGDTVRLTEKTARRVPRY